MLSVEEPRNLIEHATANKDGLMPTYFSISCFSDLSPREIHGGVFKPPTDYDPIKWDDIKLVSKDPKILVSEEHAKTRITRRPHVKTSVTKLKAVFFALKRAKW